MKQGIMQTLTRTLSFSGMTEDTKSIPLPRQDVLRVIVSPITNVTDASISSGETFWGAMKKMTAGEGANLPLWVEKDEAKDLIHMMNSGDITGAFQDPLPVTTVDSFAPAVFEGPFAFSRMENPELTMTMDPATEWATASVFSSKVIVTLIFADAPVKNAVYYHREKKATSTNHDLDMGPGFVLDALLIGTTSAYLDTVKCDAAVPITDKKNTVTGYARNTTKKAIDFSDYEPLKAVYEWWTEQDAASGTEGHALITGCNVPFYPGRRLYVVNSTTDTMLAFFRNVV